MSATFRAGKLKSATGEQSTDGRHSCVITSRKEKEEVLNLWKKLAIMVC